jgi:transmembrane sensor
LDDKNLDISQLNNNFPEPDVPVDEAWASMKQLLNHSSGNVHPEKPSKPNLRNPILYVGTGVLIIAIILFFLLKEKNQKQAFENKNNIQSKSQNDTQSKGIAVHLDTNRATVETTENTKQKIRSNKENADFSESKSTNQPSNLLRVGKLNVLTKNANMCLSYDTASLISTVYVHSGVAVIELNGKKLTLNAGESIQYDEKTKHLNNNPAINTNSFILASKIFEFNDISLKDAVELIEKAFHTTITINNKKLNNCRITTRFDNKDLKEILDIMAYTLNFQYQQDEKNNQVLLTGDGCE